VRNSGRKSERERRARRSPVKSPQTIVRSSLRDITDLAVRLFRVRYAMRMRNAAAFQTLQSRCIARRAAGASARRGERASERAKKKGASPDDEMNVERIVRRRGVRSLDACLEDALDTYLNTAWSTAFLAEKKKIAGMQLGTIRGAVRAAREARGTPVIVQG